MLKLQCEAQTYAWGRPAPESEVRERFCVWNDTRAAHTGLFGWRLTPTRLLGPPLQCQHTAGNAMQEAGAVRSDVEYTRRCLFSGSLTLASFPSLPSSQVAALAAAGGTQVDQSKPYAELW